MASPWRWSVSLYFVFKIVLWAVLCHCMCVFGQEARSTSTVEGSHISFAPLPDGEPYRSTAPNDKWILSTYEQIARAVVLSLEDEPPYDLIKEEARSLQGESKSNNKDFINKMLLYELPFLILGGISLLCTFLIPLIGLIFCCCRCRGRCGGKLEEDNTVYSPVKQRQFMAVFIVLCCVLMAIGGTGIILSSERLGSSTPAVRVALLDSIDDVIAYKNNTIAELNQLVGSDMTFTVELIEEDLEDVSSFVASPVLDKARKKVKPLVHALSQMEVAMNDTAYLLEKVDWSVQELVRLGQILRHQLGEARQNLTDLAAACDANQTAKDLGVCDKIPSGNALNAGADFTKVPNVTEQIENVKDVVKADIAKEAQLGNKSFEDITKNVKELTKSGREEILNFTRTLEDVGSDMVSRLNDAADQSIRNSILPAMNEIERRLGTNGILQEYDTYRFIGNLTLACIVLFGVLLTFVTLICGVLGTNSSDTPTTRSCTANCAGKTFMWCVALFVILSFLINLPLGVFFIIGSNLTVMCKAAGDLSLIEKTIDDPSLLGYYPVSKALLGDGNIEVQISDVLRGCGNSETPWMLLKMDQKFHLENITSYKDKIPPLDEIFEKLNSTIATTSVLTDKAKKTLNDTKTTGVDDIDFGSFINQTGQPLVGVSLANFSAKLDESAAEVKGAMDPIGKTFGESLQYIADRLVYIQADIVNISEIIVNQLRQQVERLQIKGNETLREVDELTNMWIDLQHFLKNDALVLANKDATRFMDRIRGWIDQYLDSAISKVRNQVGDCKPLKNVYDVTTSVICEHAVGALNAFWLSLGVIAVFSVITMILCVRLAKHYRRALQSSNTPRIGMYGVPLTFFDTSPAGGNNETTEDNAQRQIVKLKRARRQVQHHCLAITTRAVEPIVGV